MDPAPVHHREFDGSLLPELVVELQRVHDRGARCAEDRQAAPANRTKAKDYAQSSHFDFLKSSEKGHRPRQGFKCTKVL